MSLSSLNPLSLRRCLPGRAYSPCAHVPSDPAVAPIGAPDRLSDSRFRLLPTGLPLPAHPLGDNDHLTFLFPQPQTITLETEQYPLKTDLRAKV